MVYAWQISTPTATPDVHYKNWSDWDVQSKKKSIFVRMKMIKITFTYYEFEN